MGDPIHGCLATLKVLVQEADTNGLLLAERAIDEHLALFPNDHQRAEAILILEGGLVAVVGAFVRCSIGLYEHSSCVFRKTLTRNSGTQNALETPTSSQNRFTDGRPHARESRTHQRTSKSRGGPIDGKVGKRLTISAVT